MDVITPTRRWVETVVVGLNLCPFAKRELVNDRVRFSVSSARDEAGLLDDLLSEFKLLERDASIETTLLIHPEVLGDFASYNQFLDLAEQLLIEYDLEGVFQVASFHPDYQFADTPPDAVENYTNRSPFPMLHLIREASLEHAIRCYPEVDKIPQRNIALLRKMGHDRINALLRSCF